MINPGSERILIQNADTIATMNPADEVLRGASMVVQGNQIQEIGDVNTNGRFDRVIDARDRLVLPGSINGHHHMFQGMLKGFAEIQNQPIYEWINRVSGVARSMDEEMVKLAAKLNMLELIKYGCTTTTDMGYLYPHGRGDFFGATIEAAQELGMRFHPYRGSLSLSQKDGALFPDDVAQDSDTIVTETAAAIERYHDRSPFAMTRVGIAPCTIFSNTTLDFEEARELAKAYGVNVQTHISESHFEDGFSMENFGCRPAQYLQDLGWLGTRTSYSHGIYLSEPDLDGIAKDQTSIVHCPISNARGSLGETGIAPVWEMLERGINVALGVDGSAGNDSSNLREEMRWARTMQGARPEATYLKPSQVLGMATRGGSLLLNWPAIGSLEVGKAADLAIFPLNTLEQAGSWDPLTAFVSTQATPAETVMINGRVILDKGEFTTVDLPHLLENVRASMRILRERL